MSIHMSTHVYAHAHRYEVYITPAERCPLRVHMLIYMATRMSSHKSFGLSVYMSMPIPKHRAAQSKQTSVGIHVYTSLCQYL